MEVTSMIALGGLVALAVYGVSLYNRLVNLKHNVAKAWSNIDVLLKQRHDELPKLVEICKHPVTALTHEQMVDLLKTSMTVTVTVIPPFAASARSPNWSRKACSRPGRTMAAVFDSLTK